MQQLQVSFAALYCHPQRVTDWTFESFINSFPGSVLTDQGAHSVTQAVEGCHPDTGSVSSVILFETNGDSMK